MKCPTCRSSQISKNGRRGAKQSYRCKECGRQFIESYASRGYSSDAKQICLNLYYGGMGFRAIERATGVSHNTVINWVRQETSMRTDRSESLAVAESTEPTDLEEWQARSLTVLWKAQPATHWRNKVKGNVLLSDRLSFLHWAA